MESPKWTTKDGKVLNVVDMDDGHIKACIHMLRNHVNDIQLDIDMLGESSLGWHVTSVIQTFNNKIDMFERELERRDTLRKNI